MNLVRRIINKVVMISRGNEEQFKIVNDKSYPWIFISYISDPFFHKNDEKYIRQHQNMQEVLVMADVFGKLGFNVWVMHYCSRKKIPSIPFSMIFGEGNNFVRACRKNENAIKVFYGTSAYYKYRNEKIREMTDSFNRDFSSDLDYMRLVEDNNAAEMADYILQIGNQFTIQTYPEDLRSKITLIEQSTQQYQYEFRESAKNKSDFVMIASYGNILKGIGPVIQYFHKHKDLNLHWLGTVDDGVLEAISPFLSDNIKIYGYNEMGSVTVKSVFDKCDFLICASGVEGGPSGAVLNAMKNGIIPIVTPCTAPEGIEEYGYLMQSSSCEEVEKAVNWALGLDKYTIEDKKRKSADFISENYNLAHYSKAFYEYIRGIINSNGR